MGEPNNLKVERARLGISQLELATAVDLDHSTIYKIEKNPMKSRTEYLVRIADYFGCSIDYLIGRREER